MADCADRSQQHEKQPRLHAGWQAEAHVLKSRVRGKQHRDTNEQPAAQPGIKLHGKRTFLRSVFAVEDQIDRESDGSSQWQKRNRAENLKTRLNDDHRSDQTDSDRAKAPPPHLFLQKEPKRA